MSCVPFAGATNFVTLQKEFCHQNNIHDLDSITVTPFQRKVYEALCCVPEGYVTTYQDLAQFVNCHSCQAVGQALKRNPFAPVVPCHRVVKSDRSIGGFHGAVAGVYISKKLCLLQSEGVVFTGDGKVDQKCMFDFMETAMGHGTGSLKMS
jgi:methylated-DNA-[protein]-cysteine S-methyltransferase